MNESHSTLVVLVHGAWHSSVHWAATQRGLARRGVASVAVDLPGHGLDAPVPSGYLSPGQPGLATEKSALADVTMNDLADAVLDVLAGVRPRFTRVVLVAHSAGGGPCSLAAERAPELVDHLVYLAAFVPAGRPRFTDYTTAPENSGAVALPTFPNAAELGAYRLNPLSTNTIEVETIRRAFLDDLPSDASEGWRQLLHPDEPYASLSAPAPVSPQRWGRVPRTYIRLEDDRALPPVTQNLMIAEADQVAPETPFDVRSMTGGHSPMAVRPDELAELLAGI